MSEQSTTDSAADEERPAEQPASRAGRSPWVRWRERRRTRKAAKAHRKAPWWELPVLVLVAIGIAILVKTFVVQPFYIPSGSMEQTLKVGDRILVNKLIYDFRDPHPGDIVVFHAPPTWNDEPISRPPSNPVFRVVRGFGQLIGFVPPDGQILVKRVVAVGGQTVKGDAAGDVFVSDSGRKGPYRKLTEPFTYAPGGGQQAFGPVTIPKGRLWVMGDHRNDSADSRFHCQANGIESTAGDLHCDPSSSTIPDGNVIGKAFVVAWPASHWRTLGTPATFKAEASAAGSYLPVGSGAVVVAPVALVLRRRRRLAVDTASAGESGK